MEIQTHKRMRLKTVLSEEVAFERPMCSLPAIRQWRTPGKVTVGVRIPEKVNVCGSAKRSPQNFRYKGGLRKGRSWPIPINSPHTSWKLPPLAKTSLDQSSVTRLAYNSGVSFKHRSDFWSQWPFHCSQLWSGYLLVWIWISWKFIHHRMSVSNGWFLSLKIRFLLRICVKSNTYKTELSFFYPAFRLLKRRKMKE